MIALRGYVYRLFEFFEIDEAVEEYILIDLPNKNNIFEGGSVCFDFENSFISADIPVFLNFVDIAMNLFEKNGIIITEIHNHFKSQHFHFELPLIKENIDNIYNLFFTLKEKVLI